MTAVKLPRRLPEREPERSDPPSEVDWLRRAIRCCERWSVTYECDTVEACCIAYRSRENAGHDPRWIDVLAHWLPEHLGHVPLGELRRRLEALEAKDREVA